MDLGGALEALQRHQLPLVGYVVVVAKTVCRAGVPGEDAALPGGPGDDVVQGAAIGDVLRRRLDHLPVFHPVVGACVIPVTRIVAPFELDKGLSHGLPAVILVVGSGVDDDQVQVGLLVPDTGGPGAEEDDGLRVGLGRQVSAEIDCGRVGTRVDHGRQLVADAVAPHRRHGEVSGRAQRRRRWIWGLLTMVMGWSPEGNFGS